MPKDPIAHSLQKIASPNRSQRAEPIKKPREEPKTKKKVLSVIIKVDIPIIIKKINEINITNFGPILSSIYEKNKAPIPAVILIIIPNTIISEKFIPKVPDAYKPPKANNVFKPSV